MKCGCGVEAIINAVDGLNFKPLCQYHYKLMCIKDIEQSQLVKDICEECNGGLLKFDGLAAPTEHTVAVTFICSNCEKYKLVRKNIADYFR